MDDFPILYTRNSNGSLNQWQAILNGDSYIIRHGQVNGKLQDSLPQFGIGKNLGKKNETSAYAQAQKEVEALYKKQRKSNYFDNISDVDKGFLGPMLAKPSKDYIENVVWADGQLLEDKLNGWACFITGRGAFTRANEKYHAIPHILEELAFIFAEYPNAYLQGELFNPIYVNDLGKVAELVKISRKLEDFIPELFAESKKIVQFHWFDGFGFAGITQDTPLRKRREMIRDFIAANNFQSVKNVPFDVVYDFESAMILTEAYIAKGGEGKILKNPKANYQHKKTKDLLKLKKRESKEYRIISVEEGTGNWTGCASFVWCELPEGKKDKKFKSNVRGEREHRRQILRNRDFYPDHWTTVDFQELSPHNTPLIPYTDLVLRELIEGKGTINSN